MSQENVEAFVRRAYDVGGGRSAFDDWNWFFSEWALPELEIRPAGGRLPDIHGQTFRGRAEVERFWRLFGQAVEDWRYEVEDVIAPSEDLVVVLVHTTGRGKESGAPIDFREAHVWTLRDGRAARIEVYLDRDEAFEAAGLRE
jgi:SnoaL-like domain